MSKSKTILVVDDEKSILSIFEFILQQAGYEALIANSGEECLDILASGKKIHLIFLDIKMSKMTGIETFKKIQALCPNQLVMMMTGFGVDSLLKDAYELGAYGVIYKPFDVEEVLSTIDTIFKLPAHVM